VRLEAMRRHHNTSLTAPCRVLLCQIVDRGQPCEGIEDVKANL
jgi:uncharacterized protein (DUF302 family)